MDALCFHYASIVEAAVKTLTIKGVPESLYRELKRRAKARRRSLNAEALVCLEEWVMEPLMTESDILARIDAVRERITGVYLTNEDIDRAKREGRP
jgi:plasmid stability protein